MSFPPTPAEIGLTPELTRELAASGTLRAAINLGNPILAQRGPGGAPVGVSIDLSHAFAQVLGVPLAMTVFDVAADSVNAVTHDRADIGFFAIDPLRGAGIAFTAAYVVIEGAYLVREGSPLHSMDAVDVPGHRIVVGQGSAYDLFLTRQIRQATLVRTTSSQAVVDHFVRDGMEVAAGVRQQLESDAKRLGGLRLLPGHFMLIQQAMGLPKGRSPQALAVLHRFVERAKASRFVAQALARHRIEGAAVAAPAA